MRVLLSIVLLVSVQFQAAQDVISDDFQ